VVITGAAQEAPQEVQEAVAPQEAPADVLMAAENRYCIITKKGLT
jgi:hypothetical protein